jgi:hypothetical protein
LKDSERIFLPRRQISHEVDFSEIMLFNKVFLNAYLPEVFCSIFASKRNKNREGEKIRNDEFRNYFELIVEKHHHRTLKLEYVAGEKISNFVFATYFAI